MIVLAAVIISWVAPTSRNALVLLVRKLTEPVLAEIRKFMPDLGGIDLSPMALLLGLRLIQRLL